MKSTLKSILLILLAIVSSRSFSQTAIDSVPIKLHPSLAKLVIKDLIERDGLEQELSLTLDKVSLLENKVSLQDSVILNLNSKITNYDLILGTRTTQLSLSQELTKKLERDLKKQKIKTKLFSGAGILLVLAGTVLVK